MSSALMLAWSTPVEDRVQEFEEWYENVHLPEVRAAIGAVGPVVRYKLADPAGGTGPDRYLAVYEITDGDVAAAAAAVRRASAEGKLAMTDAMDVTGDPPALHFYVPLKH